MSKQSQTRGLIPFQPGQSGNPGGRPRGPKLSNLIAAELGKPTVDGSEITKAQMIAARLINLAEAGDITAIREVLDRTEGKSVARTESGEPGDFDLDLSQWSAEDLERAAAKLRRVK